MPASFTFRRPDDFHVHLRQGADCGNFARDAWKAGFSRVLVMPNTLPPIVSASGLVGYRREIEVAAPGLKALMTFKIRPDLDIDALTALKQAGAVAGKLYPEGVTTNSEDGIRRLEDGYPVFAVMEALGLILCLHGEHPDAFSLDREAAFVKGLKGLRKAFPSLRIVLEHVSSAEGLDAVLDDGPLTAATLTVHHLLYTLDDMVGGKLDPHLFCKPLLKRPGDRARLVEAALSGNPKFFFGSDSAPHTREHKEAALCSAGCYTMPVSLSLLLGLFEEHGALDKLEAFVSAYGADFYGLSHNQDTLTFVKEPWTVSKLYHGVVPLKAGATLPWSLETLEGGAY
jgi:dihydroorotase